MCKMTIKKSLNFNHTSKESVRKDLVHKNNYCSGVADIFKTTIKFNLDNQKENLNIQIKHTLQDITFNVKDCYKKNLVNYILQFFRL